MYYIKLYHTILYYNGTTVIYAVPVADRNVVKRRITVLKIRLTVYNLNRSCLPETYSTFSTVSFCNSSSSSRHRRRILSARIRSFASRGPRASWHSAWGGQMTQHWYLDWKNKVATEMISGWAAVSGHVGQKVNECCTTFRKKTAPSSSKAVS